MPKMKTKRAAAKRFKATGLRQAQAEPRAGSGTSSRPSGPKRKRRLRKAGLVSKADQPRLKRLVPYL